ASVGALSRLARGRWGAPERPSPNRRSDLPRQGRQRFLVRHAGLAVALYRLAFPAGGDVGVQGEDALAAGLAVELDHGDAVRLQRRANAARHLLDARNQALQRGGFDVEEIAGRILRQDKGMAARLRKKVEEGERALVLVHLGCGQLA